MAYEIPLFSLGELPADVDMSSEASFQYVGVGVYTALNTTGTGVGGAALCAASSSSSPIIGVLQNNPQVGEAGQVLVHGVSKGQMAGSVNIGDLLMTNGSGQFVKATAGNYAVAQALEKAVSGDIAAIFLIRNGKQ